VTGDEERDRDEDDRAATTVRAVIGSSRKIHPRNTATTEWHVRIRRGGAFRA